jgi:hypothetical protein
MAFDEFSDFGFFEFGNDDPTDAQQMYDQLVAAMGPSFDLTVGTYQEAKLYATAMLFGEAKMALDRARAQRLASRVTDLLDDMELDYFVVSQPRDSEDVRRARLIARQLLMRGAREEAITTELQAALGTDFIALRARNSSNRAVWPSDPRTVGTFPPPDRAPKYFRLLDSVLPGDHWVECSVQNDSEAPLVGEKLSVEPDLSNPWAERVTVAETPTAADQAALREIGRVRFRATFTMPHTVGGWVCNHHPLWIGNQRELRVIVTTSAARNPEKRRLVHEAMARHMKTTSRWHILESADRVNVGPFIVGLSNVGIVPIGPAAAPF